MSQPFNPNSLDAVIATIKAELEPLRQLAEQHDRRIRCLELWRTWIVGGGVVLMIFAPFFVERVLRHVFP